MDRNDHDQGGSDTSRYTWRSRSVFVGEEIKILVFAGSYLDALMVARLTALYFYDQDLLQLEETNDGC